MPVTENPEQTTLTLPITGMTCAACQSHVERALRGTSGVQDAAVNLMTHSARVVFDPRMTTPGSLVAAVHDAGYDAVVPPASTEGTGHAHMHDAGDEEEGSLKRKAIYSLVAAAIAMILSMPLMSSPYGSVTNTMNSTATGDMAMGHFTSRFFPFLLEIPPQALRLVLLAMSLAGMFWAGRSIYRSAWRAALHRSTNMNTLVALGTTAALLYSAAATFFPGAFLRHALAPDVYYESVLWILGFLLLGQWLEARTKRRTLAAVESFARLQPQVVHLLLPAAQSGDTSAPAETETEVPLAQVKAGDIVLVRPGERIPVDGVVLFGVSTADESLLTGESTPVQKSPGSPLIGGSLNYDGALRYRATSVGGESLLGQMIRLLDQAQSSRAPMQQLADRVSSIFVPVVLGLAALSFLLWAIWGGNTSRAFAVAVTVLVIACPCAMGLAIPAALTAAVGRGAQLGILFKGGEAVERLAGINAVAFDKTGTLTQGKPEIIGIHVEPGSDPESQVDTQALLRIAASLELNSEHPLARAVVARAREAGQELAAVSDLTNFPGKGVTGTVGGQRVAVGNSALLSSLDIPLPATEAQSAGAGATVLHVAIGGRYRGSLEARDTLRPSAVGAVRALEDAGISVSMLTGDSSAAASSIAGQLHISQVYAGLSPEHKVAIIEQLQSAGLRVAMVGDGVNDAAALARADAGIAIGTGTDIAMEAGDAILLGGEPKTVAVALRLARATRRIMRQNLVWALAYNVLGIPIAAGVLFPVFKILLSPSIASAAMAMSSVSVLLNSLRLRSFHE